MTEEPKGGLTPVYIRGVLSEGGIPLFVHTHHFINNCLGQRTVIFLQETGSMVHLEQLWVTVQYFNSYGYKQLKTDNCESIRQL